MNYDPSNLRTAVGTLAQEYFDGSIDFTTFLTRLPDEATDSSDPDIEELIDLVEHEPGVGFLGLSLTEHAEYRRQMSNVIKRLQKG
ncbi:MAG: hypothetical protein ACREAA_05735 [Candidatus Polarisedimenticolia bacterium]